MRSTMMKRTAIFASALAIALASCGSDGADDGSAVSTSSETAEATTTTTADSSNDTSDTPTADAETQADDEAGADLFPEIELASTEPGPRPTLSWSGVDGAALYQLTVLDADGTPYWSWSGTDTTVPLGGMENPDAMGAWVFEELSWMVVARDDAGAPLGMSRRGVLEP